MEDLKLLIKSDYHSIALRKLAAECSSAIEIGTYEMASTFPILVGLSESAAPHRSFLAIDVHIHSPQRLQQAQAWAEKENIAFRFLQTNDLDIPQLEPTEFLHIDSFHAYRHLSYELETFSPSVNRYILMHDTSPPWGMRDEDVIGSQPDFTRYPEWISRKKRGLWPAVQDFLSRHSEWAIHERCKTAAGYTILKRVGNYTGHG